MIESMACGTPVIASRFGAVPEVIEDGVSGVIVDTWRDMGEAIERADAIDARTQRRIVEERFSPPRMVADYLRAYEARLRRAAPVRAALGPHDREILRLALPALGALAAEPLYILVDTAIVGHLGRSQLAALGAAATVLSVMAMFNFLQYGTTAQVARASGAGQAEVARRLGAQALWLSLAVGVGLAAAIALLAEPIVALVGVEGETADRAGRTCASSRSESRPSSSRSAGRATFAASRSSSRRSS